MSENSDKTKVVDSASGANGTEVPENSVLFQTGCAGLRMVMGGDKEIIFGKSTKYRTSDADEIRFLKKEASFKGGVVWIPEDQTQSTEPPKPAGTNRELRAEQLKEFLASKANTVTVQNSVKAPGISMVSSTSSPTTGGTNPASPRYTQQETISALKGAKVVKD